MAAAMSLQKTVILYESPYRIKKFLSLVISEFGGEVQTVIARELTKIYEEFITGTAEEVLKKLEDNGVVKGELVVLLRPSEAAAEPETGED